MYWIESNSVLSTKLFLLLLFRVLVKVFHKEAYSNNTNRLRGIPALEQKIIEKLGHPVVAIDAERWTELPDYEKIPVLMHRIREKIEKFQWNQSSSDVFPL